MYWVGQDESGKRKIFFDDPKKSDCTSGQGHTKADEGSKNPKVSGDNQGKPAEKCVTNTDKVDREIEKLKEKKQQLEQQLQSASGDEKKTRELEAKLAQIESELSKKDNDTYRQQHSEFSRLD